MVFFAALVFVFNFVLGFDRRGVVRRAGAHSARAAGAADDAVFAAGGEVADDKFAVGVGGQEGVGEVTAVA